MFWMRDLTCWIYLIIAVVSFWSVLLCVESLLKKESMSPFFYYIGILLIGAVISNVIMFWARVESGVIWKEGLELPEPAEILRDHLKGTMWAFRLLPTLLINTIIAVDFTMRRFFGKRLLGRFYKNNK